WSAQKITGNLENKEFDIGENIIRNSPWIMSNESGKHHADGSFSAKKIRLSTCETLLKGRPDWHLEAKTALLEANDDLTIKHVFVKFYNIPIFYIPRLKTNVKKGFNYELRGGNSTDWGTWVHIGKKMEFNDQIKYRIYVQYRAKRGIAGGFDISLKTKKSNGYIELFGMDDTDPLSDRTVSGEPYNGRYALEDERFRINSFYKNALTDDLTVRARIDHSSDNDLLFEFYSGDYNRLREPVSYLDFSYLKNTYEVSLQYQPKVNYFYSTIEKLPELKVDRFRSSLLDSEILYESKNSLASLRNNYREPDLLRPGDLEENDTYATDRFDSAHVLYYPMEAGGIHFVPRVGARVTMYGDSSSTPVNTVQLRNNILADESRGNGNSIITSPYDNNGGSEARFAHELGFELNTRIFNQWDFQSDFWNINGIRHNLKPYFIYTYIPEPDADKDNLYYFDDTDRMDEVNMMRIGIRQDFLTKNADKEMKDFFTVDSFFDYYLSDNDDLEEGNGDFGTIARIYPTENLICSFEYLYDLNEQKTKAYNVGLDLKISELTMTADYIKTNTYLQNYYDSFAVDYIRLFSSSAFPMAFSEEEELVIGFSMPLSKSVEFKTRHRWDLLLDDNEFASERYTLTKDMKCWSWSVEYRVNNNTETFQYMLFINAFPDSKIKFKTIDEID
ncbi:MAG: hypothetical protein HRT89_00565, partial [Lentisphaeria bacterium]|nr:hypothetical protein [Lentisphaeria bacterium]NQZ66534.1 hypothetical protein [Lentisphaeria bacterium]